MHFVVPVCIKGPSPISRTVLITLCLVLSLSQLERQARTCSTPIKAVYVPDSLEHTRQSEFSVLEDRRLYDGAHIGGQKTL